MLKYLFLGFFLYVLQIWDCCVLIFICFKDYFDFFFDLTIDPFIILFSFHVFECFSVFCLWLISTFIALWSEKMLDMISIFLNLLGLVFYPNMWSILENVSCALEKYVFSAALGWNTLKTSIKSIWSSVSFKAAVSLLIFCLEDLSIEIRRVLKSQQSLYFCWSLPLCSSRFALHI